MEVNDHSQKNIQNIERKITDFNIIKIIGTGTFGKVYLALLREKPLAVKAMRKAQVIDMKQTDHIIQEKEL
jgi:serine/threonine protein kinase